MSLFEACRAAGIPQGLLIPLRPWDKPDERGNGAGKAPASVGDGGIWYNLSGWERCNTPWETCITSENYGANVGLILGAGLDYAFAALDFDLNEGCEEHRNRLLTLLASLFPDQIILIRQTRSYRALVLVRVAGLGAGRKLVFHLHCNNEKIGKIELLTTGQQCLIAGRHPESGDISWHNFGSDTFSPIPVIPDNVLTFPTYDDMAEEVRGYLEKAAEHGYWFEAYAAGKGEKVPDANLVPDWLTPDILIKFINDTPNPIEVDRDRYVTFMEAIAACRRGLIARHGTISAAKDGQLRNKAAEWVAKWPGEHKTDDPYIAELSKIENDWFKDRGNFSTGWQRLVTLARDFGYEEAPHVNASYDFRNSFESKTAEKSETVQPVRILGEADIPFIPGSEFSDSTIERELRITKGMDQSAAYIDRWIEWDGKIGGWRAPSTADDHIYTRVRFGIERYVGDLVARGIAAGQPVPPGTITSSLSDSKIEKVKKMLKHSMSLDSEAIGNRSMYCLQTPNGTYDLRTLELVTPGVRKNMFDTRYTNVAPIWGSHETPSFDSLIMGLADQDSEVADWLLHYLGYTLLGDPRQECFLVIWGPGKNGKSKLAAIMGHMLGDYYEALESKVLLNSGKDMHPTHLNKIRGKRCAITSEISANEKWNESVLKSLTGGDRITARNMNKDATTFRPELGLMVMTNEIPAFSKITPAVMRRYRIIGTTWTPPVPDTSLEEKLKNYEAPYILARLMHYAQKVYNPNGALHERVRLPEMPSAMSMVRDSIIGEQDHLYGWLRAECDWGPAYTECCEPIDELLSRFNAYLKRNGNSIGIVGDNMDEMSFRNALQHKGIRAKDARGNVIRKTIRDGNVEKMVAVATGVRLKLKAAAA